ncbi:MAG: hypothetical protein R3B84_02255 [Zavarzinella sp.]
MIFLRSLTIVLSVGTIVPAFATPPGSGDRYPAMTTTMNQHPTVVQVSHTKFQPISYQSTTSLDRYMMPNQVGIPHRVSVVASRIQPGAYLDPKKLSQPIVTPELPPSQPVGTHPAMGSYPQMGDSCDAGYGGCHGCGTHGSWSCHHHNWADFLHYRSTTGKTPCVIPAYRPSVQAYVNPYQYRWKRLPSPVRAVSDCGTGVCGIHGHQCTGHASGSACNGMPYCQGTPPGIVHQLHMNSGYQAGVSYPQAGITGSAIPPDYQMNVVPGLKFSPGGSPLAIPGPQSGR